MARFERVQPLAPISIARRFAPELSNQGIRLAVYRENCDGRHTSVADVYRL